MAQLPRYTKTGIQAVAPPRLQRPSTTARTEMIRGDLARMQEFVSTKVKEQRRREGEQAVYEFGDASILEQISQRGGPRTEAERAAYALANRVGADRIESQARFEIDRILADAQLNTTPYENVNSQLLDVVDGFSASLSQFDAGVAASLRNRLETVAANADTQYLNRYNVLQQQAETVEFEALQTQRLDQIRNSLIATGGIMDQDTANVLESARQSILDQNIFDEIKQQQLISLENQVTGYYIEAQISALPSYRERSEAIASIDVLGSLTSEQLDAYKNNLQNKNNAASNAAKENAIYNFQTLNFENQIDYINEIQATPLPELSINDNRSLLTALSSMVNAKVSIAEGQSREISSNIRDFETIITNEGIVQPDRIIAMEDRIAALPTPFQGELYDQLNRFQFINNTVSTFKSMTPINLEGFLNVIRDQGLEGIGMEGMDDLMETKIFELGQSLLTTMKSKRESDPISLGQTMGQITSSRLDFSTPEALAASIPKRIEDGLAVRSLYGGSLKFLTNLEADTLAESYASGSALQKLDLLQTVTQNFGNYAPEVFAQLNGIDSNMALVGGLLNIGQVKTARNVLTGQELIASGIQATINTTDVRIIQDNELQNALSNTPELYGSTMALADALYTKKAQDAGRLNMFDDSLYIDSINELLGYDNQSDTGGIQDVNDQPTLLMPGYNADQYETMLDNLTFEQLQQITESTNIDPGIIEDINDGNYLLQQSEAGMGNYYLVRKNINFWSSGIPTFEKLGDRDGNPLYLNLLENSWLLQ